MLLLLFLVFLVPVAAYCLILAMVNRRMRPVMLSGPWDAAGLLLAASGALLFVGPALLVILFHRSLVEAPLQGRAAASFTDLAEEWWHIWLVYYVVVVGGAVCLVWWRRGKTVIYNVDLADFERTLARLMDRLGLEWNRLGNRVFVSVARAAACPVYAPLPETPAGEPAVAEELIVSAASRPLGDAILDIESFVALCHVTLHWRRHSGLVKEELEAELERTLAQAAAPENPAGSWFLGIAVFLLALIFLGAFVIVLNAFFPPRR